MKEADFKIFSRLIQDVWLKSFPEMEFKEPINSYENKLLQIADNIEELTIDKVQKEQYPISTRSLRSYTNAVLKGEYIESTPSSRIKEILSRYVLNISKLTGKDLSQWDEKKEYRLEKYWKQYQKNFSASPVNIPKPTTEDLLNKDEKGENNSENTLEQSQQKSTSISVKNKFVRRATLPVSLILLAITLISYFAFEKTSKEDIAANFTTSFKNIHTPEQLLNTGWKILDRDDNYIREGIKNSNGKGLQLYTLPGDYWITDTMKRFIKNTFVLAIQRGDFKADATLSMSDFADLRCPHQQAGLILLNDTNNLANNIRFSVEKGKSLFPHFTLIYSKAKPEKNRWNQNLNNILSQKWFPDPIDSNIDVTPAKFTDVGLKIIKYRGYFIFQVKVGGNDRAFHTAFIQQFDFEPKFICLAAYQGQLTIVIK